jgi:hypothetical protein
VSAPPDPRHPSATKVVALSLAVIVVYGVGVYELVRLVF